jgi:putative ABC transport system substrate-binding protein
MRAADATLGVVLVVLVALLLWVIVVYNNLVRGRNRVREAWSGIDVQLRRRGSLVPNLVETVRGYATPAEMGGIPAVSDPNAGVSRARFCVSSILPCLALTLSFTMVSAPALAQQPSRPRIGYLISSSYLHPELGNLLRVHMTPVGGITAASITFLTRSAAGNDSRLPSLVTELVAARVDVIVAEGVPAALAAKATTRTVPIVMAINGDPVQLGLVASLARPGGNVTGITSFSQELAAKRLQFLKEIVPKASRVAVLWNPASPEKEFEWKVLRAAASQLGVTLQSLELRRPGDLEPRLDRAVKEGAGALLLLDDSLTLSLATEITRAVERRQLPAIYAWDPYLTGSNSGLMSYGPTAWDLTKSLTTYVDKILRGAKPGDLPVEQPTKFEFVINMQAAKALGLTLPPSILQSADRLIE